MRQKNAAEPGAEPVSFTFLDLFVVSEILEEKKNEILWAGADFEDCERRPQLYYRVFVDNLFDEALFKVAILHTWYNVYPLCIQFIIYI